MQHEPYIMDEVGIWFSNLKDLGSLRRTHSIQKPTFQYITLTETLNLVFRDEFDIYRNLYKIGFSATLINTKENKFVSNTYVSPQATIFFKDVQNFLDEQADGMSKKKPKTFKPSQDYFHDPIWIGLFRNKKEVPDVKLAIEVAQYQFDVQTKQSYGATTLGYAIIDLKSKFKTTKLYKGSVRDALQEYYQKEQKDSSFEIGFQWMEMKASDVVLKIVGPFILIGSQQYVPGVRDQRMPIKSQDLPLVEYDQLIDFNLDRVEIQLQKVVELDLQIFLIDKWTKLEKSDQIKVQKVKTYIQIVSHNGFKAINAKQFENKYDLEQRDSIEKAFIYKTRAADEISVDTLFSGCVVLFQLVQVYQIIANEVPQEDLLEIYIGWFAIPPDTQKSQGEMECGLHGNGYPTFNDNGYFIKYHAKTLGQAKIRYTANKNVHQISDHQEASTPEALRLKRLSLEISKQSKGDQESLKFRLQNMSALKKLQIKTGKIRDETLMRQNKMMNELFEMKEQTQQTLAQMVEADTQIQVKTQSLLNEFHELIVLGQQNFKLTKDKYNIEQKKLIEYQERKQKLDQIEVQTSVIVKTEELYQYSKMYHPNLKIIYRYNFTDFISTIDFGSRGAIVPKKLEKLFLQPGKKFMNIRILFSSYKSVLKLHSSVSQDDFILPNIYNFENLYPRDLEFRVHFLGNEYKIKGSFEEYITNSEKFLNNYANIVNEALFDQLIQFIDLNEKKLVIEIWEFRTQLLIGRSFLQFNFKKQEQDVLMDDIQEIDVISYDSQYVIGSYIAQIFIQTTDQRPQKQQQQKEVRIVEQYKEQIYYGFIKEVYVPPLSYDDIIRIYISQDNEFRVSFKNPFLLEPKQVILFHHCELRGNDNLKMPYFSEDEIVITGDSVHYNREIEAYIEIYTRVIVEVEKEIVIDEEDQKEVQFNTEQDLDQAKRQRTREKLKTVLSQTQLTSNNNENSAQYGTQQTQQSEFQSGEFKPKDVQIQKKIVRQEIPHLTRIYKLVIMNCESLNYDAPVAQEQILFTSHISDSNQQLKGYSSNPYCVRFQDHIPLVKNTLFKIPITCKTMDNQFKQIRFTMLQGDFMKTLLVNFRPQDCIVSKLYDIQCAKGQQQTKSIVYQNRFDKVVILQFRSTYNLIRLDTQVQEFKQFEQKKIQVEFFAYNMTRKVEIKVYIQDSDNNYFDCIMFKIQYL